MMSQKSGKTLAELDALLGVLKKHGVGLYEHGDLKIVFPHFEEEEAEKAKVDTVEGHGVDEEPEEVVNPDTGLTPSEENDMFHSNGDR